MPTRILTLAPLPVTCLLVLAAPSAALQIDDFAGIEQELVASEFVPLIASEIASGVGGFRTAELRWEAGPGRLLFEERPPFPERPNGHAVILEAWGATGTLLLEWDGEGFSGPGLALDLTEGGRNTAIAIEINTTAGSAASPGFESTISIFDSFGNVSKLARTLVGDVGLIIQYPFDQFAAEGATAADLSTVEVIRIEIQANGDGVLSLEDVETLPSSRLPPPGPPGPNPCLLGAGGDLAYIDLNGNYRFDGLGGGDVLFSPGEFDDSGEEIFVAGDFNGDGFDEVARYVSSTLTTYVDQNRSFSWDGDEGGDRTFVFAPNEGFQTPLVGDWNGDGTDEWAIYTPLRDRYLLDLNGSGFYEEGVDIESNLAEFLGPGTPIVGDWNGDGRTEIGKVVANNNFLLDQNGTQFWEGTAGGDVNTFFAPGQGPDVIPLVGDWNGDGDDDIGLFNPRTLMFLLDFNENLRWDGNRGGDVFVTLFMPYPGAIFPLVCDWNDDGRDDIGIGKGGVGYYSLDANGNFRWDGYTHGDVTAFFARTFPLNVNPLQGKWRRPE